MVHEVGGKAEALNGLPGQASLRPPELMVYGIECSGDTIIVQLLFADVQRAGMAVRRQHPLCDIRTTDREHQRVDNLSRAKAFEHRQLPDVPAPMMPLKSHSLKGITPQKEAIQRAAQAHVPIYRV